MKTVVLAMLLAASANAAQPRTGPCIAIEEQYSPAVGHVEQVWFEVLNHDQPYVGKLLPVQFTYSPETVSHNVPIRVRAFDLVTQVETATNEDTLVVRRSYADGNQDTIIFHCVTK